MLFVPHTTDSNLAKKLREKEETLKEITANKIKIVERAGVKLQDILVRDPWKGRDCGRLNCFICNTKVMNEKGSRKDCTKRNLVYEIKLRNSMNKQKKRLRKGKLKRGRKE